MIFDKTTTPISLLCMWGNVWLDAGLCAQRCVQLKPFRREQVDGMNCFEAPSDLTLPACQEMVCRFQVCLQRYLADQVIRGANVSYKKPGMHVAQVCRSTLFRNRIFDGDSTFLIHSVYNARKPQMMPAFAASCNV